MKTSIALFRGINVGGRNILPMKELTSLLEGLGLEGIRTYIQSGNVVFRGGGADRRELADRIGKAIAAGHGFEPALLLLSKEEVASAMAGNPFPEAEDDPKTLHFFFLESKPRRPDRESLQMLAANGERYELRDKVFYLHAPKGIGRSRLAASAEKKLGVACTARNWRTVSKVMALAEELAG